MSELGFIPAGGAGGKSGGMQLILEQTFSGDWAYSFPLPEPLENYRRLGFRIRAKHDSYANTANSKIESTPAASYTGINIYFKIAGSEEDMAESCGVAEIFGAFNMIVNLSTYNNGSVLVWPMPTGRTSLRISSGRQNFTAEVQVFGEK